MPLPSVLTILCGPLSFLYLSLLKALGEGGFATGEFSESMFIVVKTGFAEGFVT